MLTISSADDKIVDEWERIYGHRHVGWHVVRGRETGDEPEFGDDIEEIERVGERRLEGGQEKKEQNKANDYVIVDFEDDVTPLAQQGLIPEKVSSNKSFFSALAMVDIKVVGANYEPKFEPHQRRFNLLEDIMLCTTPHGIVEKFMVPDTMCDFLPCDTYKDMSVYNGSQILGDGEMVCTAAREKLDGVECVVFGVVTNLGNYYYLWDDKEIIEIEATQPFVCEKIGKEYYILSVVTDGFHSSIPYRMNPWTYLSKDLLDRAVEGVVLMIQDREFKVVRKKTFTLKVKGNEALDTAGKVIFPGVAEIEGLYDYTEYGQMIKRRNDRVYPDSFQQIDYIKKHIATYESLYAKVPLARISLGGPMSYVYGRVSEMMLISVSDRVILYNKYNVQAITPQYSKKKPKENKGYVSRNDVYEQYFVKLFREYRICGPYQITSEGYSGRFQQRMAWEGMYFRDGYAYDLRLYKKTSIRVFGKVLLHVTKKRCLGSHAYRGYYFRLIFVDKGVIKSVDEGEFAPPIVDLYDPQYKVIDRSRGFRSEDHSIRQGMNRGYYMPQVNKSEYLEHVMTQIMEGSGVKKK